jgi:isocitrate dehydrogenase
MAEQTKDIELKERFTKLAQELADNEDKIIDELLSAQGKPVDIGGYYKPNIEMVTEAMRPSASFNAALKSLAVVNA